MEKQTSPLSWLEEETKSINKVEFGEKLPPLKLESGKIVEFEVDFSQPFRKWNQLETNGKTTVKAIIPVTHKGEKKVFWLNVKNPLYGQICESGKKGQTKFKVSTTGTQNSTRYTIVVED